MDYTKMDDNQILALGRAGEDEATEFLLQKYGYLVKREVRTVYLIGAETEDLAQEGMIGLFKAIRDYSPDKAASFSTFASVCIRRQIQNAITNSNRKPGRRPGEAIDCTRTDRRSECSYQKRA